MPSLTKSSLTVLLAALVLLTVAPGASATHHQAFGENVRPGINEIVSVASNGAQGNAASGRPCGDDGPSMSDDGRFVAFTSVASNLDPADINGGTLPDVYLHDRKTDRTTLVSVTSQGVSLPSLPVDGLCADASFGIVGSVQPAISGDGRFIAFVSTGQMLQGEAPEAVYAAVYVHDRVKKTTELISMARSDGGATDPPVPDGPASQPAISQDGRFVSFLSSATNLVEENVCPAPVAGVVGGGCGQDQLYIYDRKNREMKLVSKTNDGLPADRGVESGTTGTRHALSDNGRFATFTSQSNLTANDQNVCLPAPFACKDVFVHDLETGKTELISVGRDGISTESNSQLIGGVQAQTISADGRFVVFESDSKDLVPWNSPLNGNSVYVRDRKENRTERITASTGEYLHSGRSASISDDGRFVMQFATGGTQITGEASGEWTGNTHAIIRHDRQTGQTDMVHIKIFRDEYQEDGDGYAAVLSATGRHLAWTSPASHGVKDANDADDVFVRDLGQVPAFGAAFLGSGQVERIGINDSSRFSTTGILPLNDGDQDGVGQIEGAEIVGARVAYRSKYDDLYTRIDLDRLAVFGGSPVFAANPLLIHGLRFSFKDTSYEVRVSGGLLPRMGLFRCEDPAACDEVSTLRGGYGTAGESVIATIPLDLIGLNVGRYEISDLQAFSALGTYERGPLLFLDEAGEGPDA